MKTLRSTILLSFLSVLLFVAQPQATNALSTTSVETPIQTIFLTNVQTTFLTPVQTVVALAQNHVLISLENGQDFILRVFGSGGDAPIIDVTNNNRRLVAVKPNGRRIRAFDLTTMESTDNDQLRRRPQRGTAMRIYRMQNKNSVIVATVRGLNLRVSAFRLSRSGRLLQRGTTRIALENTSNNAPVITRHGRNVSISHEGDTYTFRVRRRGRLAAQ